MHDRVKRYPFAIVEIIDLAQINLPFLDEPTPAIYGNYTKDHTKAWSAFIDSFDAFIFVTPEYNASIPGVLKNAIDFLQKERTEKAAAIVSYGGGGGLRAAAALLGILGALKMKTIDVPVSFNLASDFVNYKTFQPKEESQMTAALVDLVDLARVTTFARRSTG